MHGCTPLEDVPDEAFDSEGDFGCPTKPGLYDKDGHIVFVSYNRGEVELWTAGVQSAMKMLSRWATAHEYEDE